MDPTSLALLQRIRADGSETAWREFDGLYRPLIFGWIRGVPGLDGDGWLSGATQCHASRHNSSNATHHPGPACGPGTSNSGLSGEWAVRDSTNA